MDYKKIVVITYQRLCRGYLSGQNAFTTFFCTVSFFKISIIYASTCYINSMFN